MIQPITSREYKLILNNDRFHDREQGCREFWQLVEYLVKEDDGTIDKKQNDDEELRKTWYVDTSELALQRSKFILRVRQEEDEYKTTLKYRSSDRYLSAAQQIDSLGGKLKFEEDIMPPFISKFSKSAAVKTVGKPVFETVADMIKTFPGLQQLNLSETTPVAIVNDFVADEVFRKAGQIKFADQEPVLKAAFSFWYLPDGAGTYPVISEFSFSYEADAEAFPVAIAEAANNFFTALQKQAGWFDRNNDTKTAYATSLA
jgi:hypothetical protein